MLKATKKCYFNTLFFWDIVRNTLICRAVKPSWNQIVKCIIFYTLML